MISTYPSGDSEAGGDFQFNFNVLVADFNQDFRTDIDDLTILLNNFNDPILLGDFSLGDITGPNGTPDGVVDIEDLTELLNRFNDELAPPSPAATTVTRNTTDALE